jgi:hypothetical protein
MGSKRDAVYAPDPASADVYDDLYAEYVRLHDYFGRGPNEVMHRLRALRDRVLAAEPGAAQPAGSGAAQPAGSGAAQPAGSGAAEPGTGPPGTAGPGQQETPTPEGSQR